MFKNIILFLTSLTLVSFTDSQILLNQQPRGYKNYEPRLHAEGVKQYPAVRQPLTLQAQIQSISPASKYTVIPNENIPTNKIVPNPITYSYDNNLNNYENIIRKYDSMTNNPNVVNNYYIIPPETYKKSEINNRNIKYNDNISRNKGETKRRKIDYSPSRDEKGKVRRPYRHSDDDNRKKTFRKPLEESDLKNDERKKKHHKFSKKTEVHDKEPSESDEIEQLIREELDKVKKIEKTVKQKEEKIRKNNDKESKNLGEKEKFIKFEEINKEDERLKGSRRSSDEEHRKTRNLKSESTVEYQTKYSNPQDEFNKYLQNIMNGNLSYPYYTSDTFPYNLDYFYKSLQTDGETTKPKNSSGNKRNKNSKKNNLNTHKRNKERNKEEECSTVIELTPTYYESTPITISTGKGAPKDIYLNLKIKKNDSPSNDETILKSETPIKHDDKKNIDEESNNKPLTITLYEPIDIENLEYYPDFTLLNHAYLTSSEEEELHNLQNNHLNNDWDYYADKVKSYVGQSNKKQFKPHGGLENPDFLTTMVNKMDKLSTDKLNINKNVETIYAPSRVVSYNQPGKGSNYDSEEDQSNLWCKEGDTTVVYARSIDP